MVNRHSNGTLDTMIRRTTGESYDDLIIELDN